MFKSIAYILSLAAISAAPLHAEKVDWETAKQRVDAILAEREKERANAARQPATLDIVETAEAAGSFKTLSAAIEAAGLTDTLKGKGPFTVFAPTYKAFAKLPAGTVENLLKPENKAQFIDLLTKHVVAGEFPLSKALEAGEGTTLQGSMLNVRLDKGRVIIDKSSMVNADIKTTNGVIHVVDTVLQPSPFLAPKVGRLQYDMSFSKDIALYGSVDIVLVFTDSESDLGKLMDEKILLNDEFLEDARENFTFMKVENPRNTFLLSASEREENPELWKEYGINVNGKTPTILLCDQDGVIYASTDYSKGSAADLLKQLNKLHAKQAKRAERAKRD